MTRGGAADAASPVPRSIRAGKVAGPVALLCVPSARAEDRHTKREGAASRAQADGKPAWPRLLATVGFVAASMGSAHAQSEWTGASSSDWFSFENWSAGRPGQTSDATIDTVIPNATEIGVAGATAQNLAIGQNGTGMLTIRSGGTLVDSFATIGNLQGGLGTVTVTEAGSDWSIAGSLVVGGQGTGTLTIRDGGRVSSGGGSMGLAVGSTGAVTVTGPGSSWIVGPSGGLNIGSFGTGTLTIAAGGRVANIALNPANIGNGAGSQGTVTVTGAGSTWINQFGVNVGNLGRGTLTIADGGTVSGPIVIAANAGAVGTLNIGADASNPAGAPGTVTASGLTFGAGTGTINFNHTSADYVFAPAISGNGAVNALAGTTILTGANTYGGATRVSGGILRAGAAGAFSPTSIHDVGSAGTLDLAGRDQTIGGLVNAGLVALNGAPGTVLTVAGNLVGRGGAVALNTYLRSDDSPTDRLVIASGTAFGTTSLLIANAGGLGALTRGNGILVVDGVNGGTTQPGAFALGRPVIAGPYEYTLFRSSQDGTNAQAWYLRSTLPPQPPEPQPIPPNPSPGPSPQPIPPNPSPGPSPQPTPTPVPNFRQEVSLYAAVPSMLQTLGFAMLGNLHDRVGEEEHLRRGAGLDNDARPNGAWARLIVQHAARSGGGIYRDGPSFEQDMFGLQAGVDLLRRERDDGHRDHAGFYVAYGEARGTVDHVLTGTRAGTVRTEGYSLGGYWTHFGPGGWYLDALAQITAFDVKARSSRLGLSNSGDATGYAASVEAGYPIVLDRDESAGGDPPGMSGWVLEPQAQLMFQRIAPGSGGDAAARTSYDDADSLIGRVGARLARTWRLAGAGPADARRATAWLRASVYHEFLGEARMQVSSAAGPVGFVSDLAGTWAGFNAGISAQLDPNIAVYANANYLTDFSSDRYAYGGRVGVRVNW